VKFAKKYFEKETFGIGVNTARPFRMRKKHPARHNMLIILRPVKVFNKVDMSDGLDFLENEFS
jgi:hypothetical protein